MEPLLTCQSNAEKYVLFPIQHKEIWKMYKKAEACFWTAEELDLNDDVAQWENKLNDTER